MFYFWLMLRALLLLLTGLLLGCGEQQKQRNAYVKIDGSSTVFPITEAITEDFYRLYPQYKVVVGISGTGGGIRKLCRGEIDLCNASRPLEADEIERCRSNKRSILSFPVALDGIVLAVPAENDWAYDISISELKRLWSPDAQGKTFRWRDLRPEWPDLPISLFGAGTSSGTYDFFTQTVNGQARMSRGDYSASESDNIIVQGLLGNRGGMAYFGYSYYLENADRLRALAIINDVAGSTQAVLPSKESIADGSYQPFRRTQYLLVSSDALQRPNVWAYLHYYFERIPTLSEELRFVPLPATTYAEVDSQLQLYRP